MSSNMKRQREGDESPFAAQFEIIHGLTKKSSEVFVEERERAYLRHVKKNSSDDFKHVDVASFFEANPAAGCVGSTGKIVHALLKSAGAESNRALVVGTIELVAQDGEMLVLAQPSSSASTALSTVSVPRVLGNSFFPGDVILLRPTLSGNGGHCLATSADFLTYNPSVFTDAASWQAAALANVTAVLQWMAHVTAQPPGLPQLSLLAANLFGRDVTASGGAGKDGKLFTSAGFARSLQLPLLLHPSKEVLSAVDSATIDKLRRMMLSITRLYITLLKHSQSVITLSHIYRHTLLAVISSPLILESFSVALPQCVDSMGASAWTAASSALADTIHLSLQWVCPTVLALSHNSADIHAMERSALGSFETLLCRISGLWLAHARSGAQQREVDAKKGRMVTILDDLAAQGTFTSVTMWLQFRETQQSRLPHGTHSGVVSSLLEHVHQPPSLAQVQELQGLTESTVREQRALMRRTYQPYLSKDAVRFVEAAMLAAHAEVYGCASRAVHDMLQTDSAWVPSEEAARIVSIDQRRPKPSLAAFSLNEIRHHAEFGLPLTVSLESSASHSNLQESLSGDGNEGSVFAFILVRLQRRPVLFPVVVTALEASDGSHQAEVYIMKDADMLPQFIETSAAMEGGQPDAWLIFGKGHDISSNVDFSAAPVERVLPRGTPYLTYRDLLLRLMALRTDIQGDLSRMDWKSGGAMHSAMPHKAESLWMKYFSRGQVPCQVHIQSLSAAASNVVTGSGAGKAVSQSVLRDMSEAAPFTPAQVEVLHSLGNSTAVQQTGSAGAGTLSNLRILEGAVGSGKTAMLVATSLMRGKIQAAGRKEHQASVHPHIKQANEALKRVAASLNQAADQAEGEVSHDLLAEELASAVCEQVQEYERMSNGLQYCTTPLLLRPSATAASRISEPVSNFLFPKKTGEEEAGEEATPFLRNSNGCSLDEVVRQTLQRATKAPLALVLQQCAEDISLLGDICAGISAASRASEESQTSDALYAPLLSLVMSGREVYETFTESAAKKCDSWGEYLVRLWSAPNMVAAMPQQSSPAVPWDVLHPHDNKPLEAVEMPTTTHLPSLSTDQVAGWHAVYLQRQHDLRRRMLSHVHTQTRNIFQCLYDIVKGVTAASQVTKQDVVTCSERDLFGRMHLPIVWCWGPLNWFIDDFEKVQDALLLCLTHANSVTLSMWAGEEAPMHVERNYHAATSMVRSLRKDYQRSPALATASLQDRIRCKNAEVKTALSQLCVGDHSTPFVHLLQKSSLHDRSDGNVEEENMDLPDTQPCFRGLVSRSGLELWTHAVPVPAGASADDTAAEFLADYLEQYMEENQRICVVSPLPPSTGGQSKSRQQCISWNGDDPYSMDADEEYDVALISLSAFAHHTLDKSAASHADMRIRAWASVTTQDDTFFVQRLQWWLWRALARVRCGAILIGSEELFLRIPFLQQLGLFVQQQRRVLAPNPHLRYWLPDEVESSVLAMNCPDHHKCKRTARIAYDGSKQVCEVVTNGVSTCRSLCLKSFDHCESRSHACLHPCHVTKRRKAVAESNEEEEDDHHDAEDTLHAQCPYPCGKVLACEHICNRICGQPCEPCSFIGLRELPCGQRVVSGMNSDKVIQYEFFPHFQEAPCGSKMLSCAVAVSVPCPRCGLKASLPCWQIQEHQSRLLNAEQEDGAPADAAKSAFILSETECPGCVALYNKVATKHGFDLLPVPSGSPNVEVVNGEGEGDDGDAMPLAEGGTNLPRHLLTADAQTDLRKEFYLAGKKLEILTMKEALEISSGRPSAAKSDYAKYKAEFEAHKATQAAQDKARRDGIHAEVEGWATRLRGEFEEQVRMNDEMETMIPALLSAAQEEGKRQRMFTFASQ